MADLQALEEQFLACCERRDWASARRFVTPLTTESDEHLAGWAHIMLAFALSGESIRNTLACIAITDQAVELLHGCPDQLARALIRGMRYAQTAARRATFEAYAKRARALIASEAPSARRWVARLAIWIAYYYRHLGDSDRTVHWLEAAIKAAQSDQVSSPRNRRCDLYMARYALADVMLEAGHQQPAIDAIRRGMRLDPDITPESRAYLEGHLLMESGKAEAAKTALLEALRLAKERMDTPLVRRVVVALAEAHCALGEMAQMEALLDSLIQEYTDGKMFTVALHLQRVKNRVRGGEGAECGRSCLGS